MSKYESHWAESEALLALTAGDEEYAVDVISTMSRNETQTLLGHLMTLQRLLLAHIQSYPSLPAVLTDLRQWVEER